MSFLKSFLGRDLVYPGNVNHLEKVELGVQERSDDRAQKTDSSYVVKGLNVMLRNWDWSIGHRSTGYLISG